MALFLYQHFAGRDEAAANKIADNRKRDVFEAPVSPKESPEVKADKKAGERESVPSLTPAPETKTPSHATKVSEQPKAPAKTDEPPPDVKPRPNPESAGKPPKKAEPAPLPPRPAVPEVTIREIEGKSLGQWIKEIPSRDASKSANAMRMILGFGPDRGLDAVPALLEELREPDTFTSVDTSTRVQAAFALGQILGTSAQPDPAVVKDAVTVLTRMLQDGQTLVKNRAADALGKIGQPADAAVPRLLRLIHDQNSWETRQAAATALGNVAWDRGGKTPPPPEVIHALTTALTDPAAAVRLAAVKALAPLGASAEGNQKAAIRAAVVRHADNPKEEPVVRIWAHMTAMYVANEVNDAQVSAIAAFLRDPDATARIQAAKALAFIGPKAGSATPRLLASLDAKEAEVVLSCIEALAGVSKGRASVLPVLREVSQDRNRPALIRQAAQHAMDILAGKAVEKS